LKPCTAQIDAKVLVRVLLVLVLQLACHRERCQRETVAHSVEVWFSFGAAADGIWRSC
jgi:hypothetical protein